MNVVTATSREYAQYVSVMLESLYENNKGSVIYTYVCVEESLGEQAEVLKKIAEIHGNTLEFLQILPSPRKEEIKYETTINIERFQVIDLLPDDVDRFLMLGADTLVLGDISTFYNQNFENKYIIMCTDMPALEPNVPSAEKLIKYVEQEMDKRGITDIRRYGNSDVMLINQSIKSVFDYDKMVNDIIKNQFLLIEQDYFSFIMNQYIKFDNAYIYNYLVDSQKSDKETIGKIKILHFAGLNATKPWKTWDMTKFGKMWLDYAKKTYGSNEILNEYKKYKKTNKFRDYYNLVNQWMNLKEEKKNIFDKYDYKTIAVYGFGNLGKHLLYDMKEKNIYCKCVFDKNENCIVENTEVINEINDFVKKVRDVDKIIITPVFAYDTIYETLCEKGIEKNKIINIDEMLYEV